MLIILWSSYECVVEIRIINRIKIEVYNSKIKLIILGIFQNKKFVLTWTNEKVFILREN